MGHGCPHLPDNATAHPAGRVAMPVRIELLRFAGVPVAGDAHGGQG